MQIQGKSVNIRPLEYSDGFVSFKWRNDPRVWEFTGNKPDIEVTAEIECNWIGEVIRRTDEKRFAIICKQTQEYIGNVQLTKINAREAEFHIFIGNTGYWGSGKGFSASCLILHYAFKILNLKTVYLKVNPLNKTALNMYQRLGFIIVDDLVTMKLDVNDEVKSMIFNEL